MPEKGIPGSQHPEPNSEQLGLPLLLKLQQSDGDREAEPGGGAGNPEQVSSPLVPKV